MRALRTLAFGVAALVVLGAAHAKPSEAPPPRRSLRGLFGVDAVKPLLRSEAGAVRERAFERLGTLGTPRALELLARALESDGAARDARERLAAVRALAPHAADPVASDALIRALGGIEGHLDERALLVERTAALALAASHDELAERALARALRQPGRVSEHARLALHAHPARGIVPLLLASSTATPALVAVLGELGEPAAWGFLREQAESGDAPVRSAAVTALFQLDGAAAVRLARRLAPSETDAGVRAALARGLAVNGDDAAVPLFAALLTDAKGRALALDLALDVQNAEFGALLAKAPLADDRDRWFAALGHAGGAAAVARLTAALARPDDAWSALYALALCPDGRAEDVLERALTQPALRRNALRAAVIRSVTREQNVSGMTAALDALGHGDPSDRAAAAWARAVLEPSAAVASFASRDVAVVAAAARAASSRQLAAAAAARLATTTEPVLAAALAGALSVPGAADAVPTRVLTALVDARGAAAYAAAFALALRDSETLRPRLRELLGSEDPLLRAHVARGLGASADASAVGLLGEAYRAEPDAEVRRALVSALAERREPGRRPTLELAAALEPDDAARELARTALRGAAPPRAPRRGAAWLRLTPSRAEPPFALLASTSGVSLPFAADPDGMLTVVGLPAGPLELELATATPGQSPERGAPP